jgi:hypothetical protein
MYSMTDMNVKSKWKVTGIEYSGLGDKPYFILHDGDGNVKLHPVGRGVTDLRKTLNLEEE